MPESLTYWDARAERYHQRGGFAPERKSPMLEVALDLLSVLTPPYPDQARWLPWPGTDGGFGLRKQSWQFSPLFGLRSSVSQGSPRV